MTISGIVLAEVYKEEEIWGTKVELQGTMVSPLTSEVIEIDKVDVPTGVSVVDSLPFLVIDLVACDPGILIAGLLNDSFEPETWPITDEVDEYVAVSLVVKVPDSEPGGIITVVMTEVETEIEPETETLTNSELEECEIIASDDSCDLAVSVVQGDKEAELSVVDSGTIVEDDSVVEILVIESVILTLVAVLTEEDNLKLLTDNDNDVDDGDTDEDNESTGVAFVETSSWIEVGYGTVVNTAISDEKVEANPLGTVIDDLVSTFEDTALEEKTLTTDTSLVDDSITDDSPVVITTPVDNLIKVEYSSELEPDVAVAVDSKLSATEWLTKIDDDWITVVF